MSVALHNPVFLFPGQGSQRPGMGRDLAESYPLARQTFEEADAVLGFSLSRLMWDGPEAELHDTANTQPALYVHSLAALRVLRAVRPDLRPMYLAGHSLGQFSALAAAGALPFEAGLRLVRLRGELMRRAGQATPGSMAAVLGLDLAILEAICIRASTAGEAVQVANDNCPGQVVLSGARAAVERALALAREAGARRAIPLAVSVAAHSPLMGSIQSEFAAALAESPLMLPDVPVICNVTARPLESVEEMRANLISQLTARVRWRESVEWMGVHGGGVFLEIGCGNVLGGLVGRILPEATTLPVGTAADLAALT
ncbi:MAG: ACP S-malonyltransferase [Anaerolineales bacterium]